MGDVASSTIALCFFCHNKGCHIPNTKSPSKEYVSLGAFSVVPRNVRGFSDTRRTHLRLKVFIRLIIS